MMILHHRSKREVNQTDKLKLVCQYFMGPGQDQQPAMGDKSLLCIFVDEVTRSYTLKKKLWLS